MGERANRDARYLEYKIYADSLALGKTSSHSSITLHTMHFNLSLTSDIQHLLSQEFSFTKYIVLTLKIQIHM